MDELNGLRKRYDEAASWALVTEPQINNDVRWIAGQKNIRVVYGAKQDFEVIVHIDPLQISLLRNGKEQVVLNGQGLLHMEHFRTKTPVETKSESEPEPASTEVPEEGLDDEENAQVVMKVNPRAWFEGDTEDAWWEETFSSWTDSKPKGEHNHTLATIDINSGV
jgi:alpha 1,3-glucosidase